MAVVRIEGSQSCRAEVLDAGRHVLAEQYRLISRIAALDVSDEWAADGAASCAHWVAVALDTMVSTAREWVRIGRALRVLDEIDAAFAAGRPVVQQGARTHKSCDSRDAGRVVGIGRTRPGGWARSRVGGLADAAGDPSRNRGSTGSEHGVVVERRRRRDGCADGAAPTRRDGATSGRRSRGGCGRGGRTCPWTRADGGRRSPTSVPTCSSSCAVTASVAQRPRSCSMCAATAARWTTVPR